MELCLPSAPSLWICSQPCSYKGKKAPLPLLPLLIWLFLPPEKPGKSQALQVAYLKIIEKTGSLLRVLFSLGAKKNPLEVITKATSAPWGSNSSKHRPRGEKYWYIQPSLLQQCLASCPWTYVLVFLGHFLSHSRGKCRSPHGSAVRPANKTLQFKWNSCMSGCQDSCSFEAEAPFGEKKKDTDHKKVSNYTRHWAIWDASS